MAIESNDGLTTLRVHIIKNHATSYGLEVDAIHTLTLTPETQSSILIIRDYKAFNPFIGRNLLASRYDPDFEYKVVEDYESINE